ncbi:MAG: ATP-binding protein [Lachnospiraceae bacterium]|nr:ATP-binding protein [Lachnospiraceae bacterium]
MYRNISKLVLFSDLGDDCILYRLSNLFEIFDKGDYDKSLLITEIYKEIKHLLDLATDYGFDDNLWHNYLTFLLITDENSFTLTSEKVGASDGTVNYFAKNDFKIFKELFDFDFTKIENELGIDCFTTITNYKAIPKKERMYNRNVSEKVRELSKKIELSATADEIFDILTSFYADYGIGMFGLNKAFRIRERDEALTLFPINNTDEVMLDDLIGYEIQKQMLIDNTKAFVEGRPANNCLLFGDSGTGKSTMIKAILNQYYSEGLRMIEIYKHQFKDLSSVINLIKNRNYRFIIYMDDLSFEDFEVEYKFLKAVIEGGVESKPDNVLIYATSNRRHLIKESFNDRNDMTVSRGLHHSDTIQEKLSLVNRFGVTISFSKPNQKEYYEIVLGLTRKEDKLKAMSDDEIMLLANQWELNHGGLTGRTARQFVDYLLGRE